MHTTLVGVDLAKAVIQVCVVKHKKALSNSEMLPDEFSLWLSTQRQVTVVFEAGATSNYWRQKATACGHDARLISAKRVANIRPNQKTDKNDALAIVQASQLTGIQFITGKTFSQQELQSISKMRELAVKQKVALTNQMTALLLEFNIRVSPRNGGLSGVVQATLEEAENRFSLAFREALAETWKALLDVHARITRYEKNLESAIAANPDCKKLLALESVSTINAVHLYTTLACGEDGLFKSARDASA